jgi:hypothetical protein
VRRAVSLLGSVERLQRQRGCPRCKNGEVALIAIPANIADLYSSRRDKSERKALVTARNEGKNFAALSE